ncbi:ras-related and estrogen-regulated growth inhibitor-like [Antedon mediterranea]|uniref:ras-related and estrogen-regulated growth inhibitor-like n=1 Tax=Antedon mediterranea TaxID=105859 RepID=UPI003AF839C4
MIRLTVPAQNLGSGNGSNGKMSECKLVVLGNSCVGKSAAVVRFLTNRFIWEYDPTLECTYRHQTTVDNDVMTVDILDTAGGDTDNHREGQIRWGEGFLVMYSVTDRQSFDQVLRIKSFLDEVKKARNVSIVILGNKADLEHEREVSYEEGEKLSEELACAFYETSICLGDRNVYEAFHELVREVRRRKMVDSKQRRRSSTSQQMKQVLKGMFTKINNIH